jgi:group II intron reverse transcriptase/maturase
MRKKVPMRDAGADQPVVVMKPGNAGGAKGLDHLAEPEGQPKRDEPRAKAKSYCISKRTVLEAYKRVKANRGSAGVDGESLAAFETDLGKNLYKVWNRMSSGSYFPPPVRRVGIPKKDGGQRLLGVPTVADRIAQTVAKMYLEPLVEQKFHPDSYGYRPGKSALDAVGTCRQRCWRNDWVIDLDIKGFFDNLNHDLILKAVRFHTDLAWLHLYVGRWLRAPVQREDGSLEERTTGSPQGGSVSPLLANLFMHHAFDDWMRRNCPDIEFERYADDVVIHCMSEAQAKQVLEDVRERLQQCGLELHPEKTKIVYCKDAKRRGEYDATKFDFLGYTFRARLVRNQCDGTMFVGYVPAISAAGAQAIRARVRSWRLQRAWTGKPLEALAEHIDPFVRGWINYYGRFSRSECKRVLSYLNRVLVRWAARKYKRFKRRKRKAARWLAQVADRDTALFALWRSGVKPRAAGW